MQIIPIQPLPAQAFNVTLGGQSCALSIYQKSTGLFLDLSVSGAAVMTGVVCLDRSLLVRQPYLGFIGDLSFVDTYGKDDPQYTGLGMRWVLAYLSPSDLSAHA